LKHRRAREKVWEVRERRGRTADSLGDLVMGGKRRGKRVDEWEDPGTIILGDYVY